MKEIKYTILYCVCENLWASLFNGSSSGTVINYGSGSDFLARYDSGSGDFLARYDSGSGSASQKVTVPTVPVPQRCQSPRILAHIRGRSWSMVNGLCDPCSKCRVLTGKGSNQRRYNLWKPFKKIPILKIWSICSRNLRQLCYCSSSTYVCTLVQQLILGNIGNIVLQ